MCQCVGFGTLAESCFGRVPEGCFGSGTRATKMGAREEVWHSKLASTLLEQRVWGDIAALLLQQLASAAMADSALHPELLSLSKVAHTGRCPGNCHKDLQRYLTLDTSGDKVDTELSLMPLHRVGHVCLNEGRTSSTSG